MCFCNLQITVTLALIAHLLEYRYTQLVVANKKNMVFQSLIMVKIKTRVARHTHI